MRRRNHEKATSTNPTLRSAQTVKSGASAAPIRESSVMSSALADYGYLALALVFNTFTAPAVKMTQNADGGYSYNKYRYEFLLQIEMNSFSS